MRILFVFNHPAPYKVELLRRIAQHLDITVIFERHSNSDRNRDFYVNNKLDFPHIFIKGLPLGKENCFSTAIKNHIKNNHYDLIVMNGYSTFAELIAINYLIKKGIPYALYINGGVIRNDFSFKYRLKKKLISNAFRYYSPSSKADGYLLHYGARKEDIRYYPYATISEKEIVTMPLSPSEREQKLKEYNVPTQCPIFISIGQFISRKNMSKLLEIFKLRPDYHLILVGGGPQKKQYENFIKQNDIHNVTILPFLKRKDLFPLLRACDAMILLSKEDIYGHVINEAFSQGLGVIASDRIVAARTLIKDGENGYIVSLNDDQYILKTMDLIINNSFFNSAIETASKNTYEISASIHVALWKEEDR